MTSAAVMGAGAWGTAFAATLVEAGTDVTVWGRRAAVVAQIEAGRNEEYLPGIPLPAGLQATTDPEQALAGKDLVVVALPAQAVRENLRAWGGAAPEDAVLLSLVKGLERDTTLRMTEVLLEETTADPGRVAALSGPNLAPEIAVRQPAAGVVASADRRTAELVAAASLTGFFRVYPTDDVVGTELGGAVKNVVALVVGMAHGMGMGDNTKASIITRGLAEIARLGSQQGAKPSTFLGLAGVGDLIVTCMSPQSRNRTFGVNLGQGMTLLEARAAVRQTVEGVTSCHAIRDLAHEHEVYVPIVDAVATVLDGERTPAELVELLMSRSLKHERA